MGTCGSSSDTPAQAANILSGNIFNDYLSTSSNIFFSPFSVLTAMSMAQEGANGNTACQIQTALNINSAASVRQSAFQQLISEINSSSKHYTLATANNLWPQVGFPVLSSYISVLQNDYFAGVTTVDYINNPTGALNTINSTVSQETDGYIPKLLSASNINPGTRVILTNAIYFKGTWQYQFPVSNTAPRHSPWPRARRKASA
jgi:serpin B